MKAKIAMLAMASAVLSTMAYGQDTVNICDRTPQVRDAILELVDSSNCAAVSTDGLAGIQNLNLREANLATIKANDFDGLSGLTELWLDGHRNRNPRLRGNNQLTSLPAGVFDSLTSLEVLHVDGNQFTTLPSGVFDSLTNLKRLDLHYNQLTTLPVGVFDNLTALEHLHLGHNLLESLPAGLFDNLTALEFLALGDNLLESLPAGLFDNLTALEFLALGDNQLKSLQPGVFDNLTNLEELNLRYNHLTTLAGLFNNLPSLRSLNIARNRFEPVEEDHPWFAMLGEVTIQGAGAQNTKSVGYLNLLLADSQIALGRQGFVRISNFDRGGDVFEIIATDDSGYSADTVVEIYVGAHETVHFNSSDLENGNPNKGIQTGIGAPVQGDWRLQLETYLPRFDYDAYVRTTDGLLTGLHRSVPYSTSPAGFNLGGGAFTVDLFNPASNTDRQSRLRIVNEGASAANVQIYGRDDMGNIVGPVTFSLPVSQVRTLSAVDLEQGASNVEGMLGDGVGKWRLAIQTDHHPRELDVPPMAVMNLLYSSSGQITSLD